MAWVVGNRALTQAESDNNGNIVASFFLSKGWNRRSVAAICGCMYAESYINPQLWEEGMPQWGPHTGFGLVQWTPATELTEVCEKANLGSWDSGTVQLQAIMVEYATTDSDLVQWLKTSHYPISFQQWAMNTANMSVDDLTQCFMENYLRPADIHQPRYQAAAQRWYNIITNGDYSNVPVPGGDPTPLPVPDVVQVDFKNPLNIILLKSDRGRRQDVFKYRR